MSVVGILAIVIVVSLVIVVVLLRSKNSDKNGRSKGKSKINQPAPDVNVEALRPDANGDGGEEVRPAHFNAGGEKQQPLRVMVPEADEDFYEEKTVASYDDLTAGMYKTDEDDITVPFFAEERPVPTAVLTRVSDGQRIVCKGENFTVGKSQKSADYKLSDNQKISRVHTAFYEKDGKYVAIDMSKNGTFINDVPLVPETATEIDDGAIIRFADEEYRFNIETR